MDLLQRTYDLMEASKLRQREIAAGAGVKLDWFRKFMQRRIPEPGVTKVQAVHDFLSRRSGRHDHAA